MSARKLATAALACGSVGICLLCAPAGAQQTAADPLKSGIARVEAGDFRMGIMTLNEVIDPDSTASASDQARAHAYRAQAYLGLNEPERARAALLLALKADASVKVTAPPFSLALVNLFEAVTAPADANHEATAAAAAAAGNYQQAFVHYLSAYEALPDPAPTADDRRLRERIIDVVRRLNTRPAIPAEAAAHFDKATQLLEAEAVLGAGGTATAEAAATELQRAIRIAPWWPEATFKLAGLEQKLQRVDAALINLNLYKRADPEGYAAATAPKTALPREAAAPRLASRPATAVIPPATIYVYWLPTSRSFGKHPKTLCDGQQVAELGAGRFIKLTAPPGAHTIKFYNKDISRSFDSGKEHYVRIDIEGFPAHFALKAVKPEDARAEMEARKITPNDANRTFALECAAARR